MRRVRVAFVCVLLVGCAGPSEDASPEVRPADVARITCRGAETDVETPVVQATRAGVRVEVTNRTGESVTIYGLPLRSKPGVHRHLVDVGPGVFKVACIPQSLELERFEPPGTPLEILPVSSET